MTPKGNSASIPASEAHSPQEPETSVKLVRRRREASLQPYLSVVVATRNDDHGVDLLRRTQIFLDGPRRANISPRGSSQCRRTCIDSWTMPTGCRSSR
jgi:hypothetical protein